MQARKAPFLKQVFEIPRFSLHPSEQRDSNRAERFIRGIWKHEVVAVPSLRLVSRSREQSPPEQEHTALKFALWCPALLCWLPWWDPAVTGREQREFCRNRVDPAEGQDGEGEVPLEPCDPVKLSAKTSPIPFQSQNVLYSKISKFGVRAGFWRIFLYFTKKLPKLCFVTFRYIYLNTYILTHTYRHIHTLIGLGKEGAKSCPTWPDPLCQVSGKDCGAGSCRCQPWPRCQQRVTAVPELPGLVRGDQPPAAAQGHYLGGKIRSWKQWNSGLFVVLF